MKAEGEDQVAAALSRNPGLVAMPLNEADTLPSGYRNADGWLRTRPDMWPETGALDGFFAARFTRQG